MLVTERMLNLVHSDFVAGTVHYQALVSGAALLKECCYKRTCRHHRAFQHFTCINGYMNV